MLWNKSYKHDPAYHRIVQKFLRLNSFGDTVVKYGWEEVLLGTIDVGFFGDISPHFFEVGATKKG